VLRRKSIQLLITELGYGGTPRAVQALARGLRDRGHDIHIVSLMSGGGVAEELSSAGFRVTGLAVENRSLPQACLDFVKLLRRERPLVLHTFLFHANLLGRVAGRLAGIPIVIASERSVEPAKRPLRVWTDRLTWRLATCWTVNADATANVLATREGISRDRIAVIPSGVDVDRFRTRPEGGDRGERGGHDIRARFGIGTGDIVLVSVGRLDRLKGQDHIIEALPSIGTPDRRVVLVLVGDGPERPRLEGLIKARGLAGRVHFAGAESDVRPYLAAADLFVLASTAEGMSGALLEAMAWQLPVVATAVGGTPEVVVNGESGLLVPPRDEDALARACRRLLDDPDAARAMGRHGRARIVEHFSLDRVLDRTEALYRRLIGAAEQLDAA
jgi:glycosyltransferase involved in cell wall biosynthesis